MTRRIRKTICAVAVSAVCVAAAVFTICATRGAVTAQAAETQDVIGTVRYIISNPYSDVDWDTWGQYKAATHVHSKISDGDFHFADQIENYYALGYDAVAMTDHAAVNRGWTVDKTKGSERPWWFFYNGVAANMKSLTETRNYEITHGVGRDGRGMIDIPLGIELNGASVSKCHVNGFFADAGQNEQELNAKGIDGCVTAVYKNDAAGGITHINHVGEFMEANDCSSLEEAKSKVYTPSWIDEFAQKVFRRYSSCVGMELVNKSDNRTKWDRYLYDELLKRLAPEGRLLWGFCGDDSHKTSELDQNCAWFVLPSLTADNIRTAMETGCFFCSSRRSKTELNDATGDGDYPRINRITIDDKRSQIILSTVKAKKAVLIADGNTLETVTCDPSGAVVNFDLNNYESQINSYVRIYLTGDGGITYVQPFHVTATAYDTAATVNFHVTYNGEPVSTPFIIIRNSNNVFIPMTTSTSVQLVTPDTYYYSVALQQNTQSNSKFALNTGSHVFPEPDTMVAENGSFVITFEDIVLEKTFDLQIGIVSLPELVPNTELNYLFDETTKTITGLKIGTVLSEDVATSSNSLGTIEIVPTEYGYGTGTRVNLVYDGRVIDSYTCVIYGDTNGDTFVDATDAIRVQAYLCPDFNYAIPAPTLRACDVDNDGEVTAADARIMRMFGLGLKYRIIQYR